MEEQFFTKNETMLKMKPQKCKKLVIVLKRINLSFIGRLGFKTTKINHCGRDVFERSFRIKPETMSKYLCRSDFSLIFQTLKVSDQMKTT